MEDSKKKGNILMLTELKQTIKNKENTNEKML